MRRGELVTVVLQGDYGKPRPAVIVQSDWLDSTESVLLCLLTSELRDAPVFRLTLEPSARNGLQRTSQIMADKVMAVRRGRCGPSFGHLSDEDVLVLNRMLSLVFGLVD